MGKRGGVRKLDVKGAKRIFTRMEGRKKRRTKRERNRRMCNGSQGEKKD